MLHRKRNRALSLAVLALGFFAAVPAMAAVTPGGDTTVGATSTQDTTVGNTGIGTLSIDGGSTLADAVGYLGYSPGSTGTATVSGPGSTWTNSGNLVVGNKGDGVLTIEDGAQVSNRQGLLGSGPTMMTVASGTVTVRGAGTKWINSDNLVVGFIGRGLLTIEAGGQVSSLNGTVGRAVHPGTVIVNGSGSTWTTGMLTVGDARDGTLTITAGGQVISGGGILSHASSSSSRATVSGTGSKWVHTYDLYVGENGSGELTIEARAQVSDRFGYLGYYSGSAGSATVCGAGSTWVSTDGLVVGSSGTGKLTVADGGSITAKSLSINNLSAVRLHVSGDDMLMLGNATTTGNVTNNGTVSLFADASLPADIYRPISAYPGRTMTWSGSGSYKAFGGTWDNAAKTFTVAEATALLACDVETVATGQRLLFTDSLTGRRAGASFGAITGSVSFSAALMEAADLASLAGLLEDGHGVLSAWDFTTDLSSGEVMLSFDVGPEAEGLAVWHLEDGVWSSFTPGLFTYDSNGIASFTVNSFSGYALTAAVPEPGMMGLLVLAGAMLLARRWA